MFNRILLWMYAVLALCVGASAADDKPVSAEVKIYWSSRKKVKLYVGNESRDKTPVRTKRLVKLYYIVDKQVKEVTVIRNKMSKAFRYTGPSLVNFYDQKPDLESDKPLPKPKFVGKLVSGQSKTVFLLMSVEGKGRLLSLPFAFDKGDEGKMLVYNSTDHLMQIELGKNKFTLGAKKARKVELLREGQEQFICRIIYKDKETETVKDAFSRYYHLTHSGPAAAVISQLSEESFTFEILPAVYWSKEK